MTINFSRHARRRMKLFKIPPDGVAAVINESDQATGHHEVVQHFDDFTLPIKIVYEIEGETITVVTAYPLKRGTSP